MSRVSRHVLSALCLGCLFFSASTPALAFDAKSLKINAEDPGSGQLKKVVATGVINAPINKVWQAVTDYPAYSRFMPRITYSHLDKRSAHLAVATMKIDLPFPFQGIVYTNKYVETLGPDYKEMEWILLKSNKLKSNNGGWKLRARGSQTLATYTVIIDPGVPLIPKWMIETATKQTIPSVFEAVEKYARKL